MVLCIGAASGCSRPSRDGCDRERPPPPCCCSVVDSGSDAESSSTGEMSALLQPVAAEHVPPLLCVNSACDDGAGVTMQAASDDCHITRDITVVVGDNCNLRDKDFADYAAVAQFSDDSTTDSCIPCVIASEMIVTTSRPPRISKRPRKTRPCKISCEVVSEHGVGVAMSVDSSGGSAVDAAADMDALAASALERVEQVGSDVENGNTCYLSSTSTDVIEQRLCDLARSRSRMRLKRADPEYRELERQRDRERRRCARQTNLLQRQAEKARDREYRRRRRQEQQQLKPCAATMADVCQRNYFDDAYESCVDGSARANAIGVACDASSVGNSL